MLNWQGDALERANDLAGAIAAAETALQLVVENTQGAAIRRRAAPAQRLAAFYAADKRFPEARALYEQHVLNDVNSPLQIGEAKWLELRLGLANLEAVYAPTPDTLTTLDDLLKSARQSASRDPNLQRMVIRAQSLARYGLGQGLASLLAGRNALRLRQSFSSEKVSERSDRRLLETMVGSGLMAALQTSAGP